MRFSTILFPLLMSVVASAQSPVPFTITNLNLQVNTAGTTYITNVTVLAGSTATVNGAGLTNQTATVTGTGSAARERGLGCGGTLQLALTFTFNSSNSISVLANAPFPKNATTANLSFTVTGGTGLFQGTGGSGTINGTLNQTATPATITGSGSGNLVAGASPGPVISPSGIVPVFSSVPIIQPGSWISIYGANFDTQLTVWKGDFPTKLGAVTSVTIDSKPAYLWYVSPTQINAQVPDDSTQGCVAVAVNTANGTATSQITLQQAQPSFSLWSGTQYAAGFIRPSDGSYVFLGPATGLGVTARAAKVGEVAELYGVGFGPVAHPVPAGQQDTVSGQNATNFQVGVTVGGKQATVLYAGLSQAGAYQLDFIVPQVPTGDNLVIATVNAPNPLLFSSFATQNCQDPNPQGPGPTTCNIYIPVQ